MNRVRERLYIQLKLFVVMGLPWLFEPISWAVDSSPSVAAALPFSTCWIWLVTDLVNMLQVSWMRTRGTCIDQECPLPLTLQGVFIMVIFVAKRSVARKLARRFGFEERGANLGAHGGSSSEV